MSIHNLQFALEDAVSAVLLVVCPKCGNEHDADPSGVCPSITKIEDRIDLDKLTGNPDPEGPLAEPEVLEEVYGSDIDGLDADEEIDSEVAPVVNPEFDDHQLNDIELSVEGIEESIKPEVNETNAGALPDGIPHPEANDDSDKPFVDPVIEQSESKSDDESSDNEEPSAEPEEPKDPTPVVLEEPVQDTIPELWAHDEQHTADSAELDNALQSLTEVQAIDLATESMAYHIRHGDRATAELVAGKIYEMMGAIADRHGIQNKPTLSVQLESLSDQTWLEYVQEETSVGTDILIRVLVNILTKVAIGLLAWLAYNFTQARAARKAAEQALKSVATQDPELVAQLAREANLKYTPVFDWDRHSYYAPKDYLQALDHLRSSVLPSVQAHLAVVDNTIELDRNYISRSIIEWSAESNGRIVNKEDSAAATRKWADDVQKNVDRAAHAIAGQNGIHLGGLMIASDHKVKQRLIHNARSVADPSSLDAVQSAGVGKENIIFSPYYFVKERRDPEQGKSLSIADAGKVYDIEPYELIQLARKENAIKDTILGKLETIKNSNASAIQALEKELVKIDDILKSRKLKTGHTTRMNELKVSVGNAKNNLGVIRNTFTSFGRLFFSASSKEGFHT